MKLCRFQPLEFEMKDVGRPGREMEAESRAGIVEDGAVLEIQGPLWGGRQRTGREWPAEDRPRDSVSPPSNPIGHLWWSACGRT